MMCRRTSRFLPLLLLLAGAPVAARDGAAPGDTLHLPALQARAVSADARAREAPLHRREARLRADNFDADRLPRIVLSGEAAYQSETVTFPSTGQTALPEPPLDRYEAALQVEWTVWDGGDAAARKDAEEARLAVTLAGLDAEVWEVRTRVETAFFSALLLQEELRSVAVLRTDLGARLDELRVRVDAGLALPGDTATLLAEILRVEQREEGLRSERSAALAVLYRLAALPAEEDPILVLPELDGPVASVTLALGDEGGSGNGVLPEELRVHPGFRALEAQRLARDRRAEIVRVARRPTLSAVGRAAWGSPGYLQFSDELHDYWRAGLQLRWQPWVWNRTRRELEQLQLERERVDARERHLAEELVRAAESPLRRIRFLEEALETDQRIIRLREAAEAQARARFDEQSLSAADYTDARTDVQEARVQLIRHRIERVRAQARLLTLLGLHLPSSGGSP